uniref:Uncharacterized protein n=1 Tax=Triticum urartu TaxID=4572 RepID=A0A8R7TUJ5_TRIUA
MGLRRQRGSAPHLVWLHSVFARAGDELRSMVLIRLGYIDFDADGSERGKHHNELQSSSRNNCSYNAIWALLIGEFYFRSPLL